MTMGPGPRVTSLWISSLGSSSTDVRGPWTPTRSQMFPWCGLGGVVWGLDHYSKEGGSGVLILYQGSNFPCPPLQNGFILWYITKVLAGPPLCQSSFQTTMIIRWSVKLIKHGRACISLTSDKHYILTTNVEKQTESKALVPGQIKV